MRHLLLAALLGGSAACRTGSSARPDAASPANKTGAAAISAAAASSIPGVPHAASIDRLAIAPDGSAAISIDKAGSVRLWGALDGSREPLPLPLRGPRAASLARRGDGHLIGLVDSAGGAKLLAVDGRGTVTTLATLDPLQPVKTALVLPGGERVLVLHEDHRIRLLTADGRELQRLERREFRPAHLFVEPEGAVLAVAVKRRSTGKIEASAQLLAVSDAALSLLGKPVSMASAAEPDGAGLGFAPGGRAFAFLEREGPAWRARVVALPDGKATTIDLQMQDNQVPALGFVGPRRLLVTSRERAIAWLVDIEDQRRWPRVAAGQPSLPLPIVYAPGVAVAGYGTWLAVHTIEGSRIDYVGYRAFAAQSGAISPKGRLGAWAAAGEIVVEPVDAPGEAHRVRPDSPFGAQFLAFADEDHVVAVGNDGTVRLVRWRDDTVVSERSLGTSVHTASFDLAHGLFVVHRIFGDLAVVEVSRDRTLQAPRVIADGSHMAGLLAPVDGKGPGVWTLDAQQKLRTYRIEELRQGITAAQQTDRGETIAVPAGGHVVTVDRRGRPYVVVQDGLTQTLQRQEGTATAKKVSLGAHRVSQLVVSPDASTLVALADTGVLLAFDGETLASRWSWQSNLLQGLPVFSPDGKRVIVMTATGVAHLDARTGEIAVRRCGVEFGRRGAAPFDAFSFSEVPSFCE